MLYSVLLYSVKFKKIKNSIKHKKGKKMEKKYEHVLKYFYSNS
jgi:hypothetical protein